MAASMRILMVSTTFRLPYQVMRCAQAAGATVYVLGTRGAVGLKHSRHCEGFVRSARPITGAFDPALATEINRYSRTLDVQMILPADISSTRSLITLSQLLDSPCFPMPELSAFDLLNDKWQFYQLCRTLGITSPESHLFPDVLSVKAEISRSCIPRIAKPLSMDGGIGCIMLDSKDTSRKLTAIFYKPILVQEFIPGEDISAGVFCVTGEIHAFVAYRYYHQTHTTFFEQSIFDEIGKLARHLKLDGVFNFDMRLARDGRIFFLECNPRFFIKVAMSMLAGINFVALGLRGCIALKPPQQCGEMTVRFPKAILGTLHLPWKISRKDWEALKFALCDPIPYLLEELRLTKNVRTAGLSERGTLVSCAPVAMVDEEAQ
jgi:hypothetical protein